MRKSLLFTLHIIAAIASAHASFLGDLATNAKRVGSSPYATGGDIILCLDSSANEYVHVFTNTAPKTYGSFTSATFTPAQAMAARILLIGGGGGGANTTHPGGGGGGGFVETNNVRLSAAAYTVKIASGGTSANGSSGGNGGPSAFVVGEGDTITAYGGGGGGRAAAGLNGATGGGGDLSKIGGSAIYGDQGYAGGDGSAYGGAGGGGAGVAGGLPVGTTTSDPKSHAGNGGNGRVSDIPGFEQYFGGGGGTGGLTAPGTGGAGGGHSGGNGSTDIYGGENGLGGGGGANNNPSNTGKPGKGGSGIVIIRYFARSETTPFVHSASIAPVGGSAVSVSGILGDAGTSAATLKMKYWPSAAGEDGEGTVTNTIGTYAAGSSYSSFDANVGGLPFDTPYSYKIWAENASGSSGVKIGSFTTLSATLGATATVMGNPLAPTVVGADAVYTFTSNGTFTVAAGKRGFVKLLVVAGGGGGGAIAGGGGGGRRPLREIA